MLKHELNHSLKQLQCCKSAAESVQHVGQSSIPAVCLHAGDEVTISYFGDLSSHKDLRQRALGVAWHFACSCPRCTVEEALHSKFQSMLGYLGTEAGKHGSQTPDRFILYSYSYTCIHTVTQEALHSLHHPHTILSSVVRACIQLVLYIRTSM